MLAKGTETFSKWHLGSALRQNEHLSHSVLTQTIITATPHQKEPDEVLQHLTRTPPRRGVLGISNLQEYALDRFQGTPGIRGIY